MKKRLLSLLMALSMVMSLITVPTAFADTLSEKMIDLSDKKMYRFDFNSADKVFKYTSEVSSPDYTIYKDVDYTTDGSAVPAQKFVVIDLGEPYPISTIKAYQSKDNTSSTKTGNFIGICRSGND